MQKFTRLLATLAGSATLAIGTVLAQAPGGEGGGPRFGRDGQAGPPGGGREEMTKRFDTDGDGVLSAEERQAMHAAMQGEMEKRLDEAFVKADVNGDGLLSKEEFKAAAASMRGGRMGGGPGGGPGGELAGANVAGGRGGAMMGNFDTNKDGALDDNEKAAAKKHFGEMVERVIQAGNQQAIARIDTDGNGQVSEAEKGAAIDKMVQRLEQGGERPAGAGPRGGRGAAGPGEGGPK